MIYADYNATTPISQKARTAMNKALESWGNPSSTHALGREAEGLLEEWRQVIATQAGTSPADVVFTSGGSEANTMALLGSCFACQESFRLLTSSVEHSSIQGTLNLLERCQAQVKQVGVLPTGALDWNVLERNLQDFRPHLVSIMTANNETGVLFPVREVTKLCRKLEIPVHTDAVQAFGKISPQLWNKAEMISISAHKIYGPKGVGALIVKEGPQLMATHFGGSQETKRRGGTQNMVGIAGFAGAASALPDEAGLEELARQRDNFEQRLQQALPDVLINGGEVERNPSTSNLRFQGVSSEILLSALDLDGICVSAGSACASGSISPSPVLLAMGLPPEQAKESIRFSWGTITKDEEIEEAADIIIRHVKRIRARRS